MSDIIEEYKREKDKLMRFCTEAHRVVENLLNKVKKFHISSRLKEEDSLEQKLSLKGENYTSLSDITDIVGLRVITYLESEVDMIAEVIKKNFVVDSVKSTDKRILPINEFGYKSLHYIVSFPDDRTKLEDYSEFKGLKFEIQIRSILQHAWAEIEHDIGYKSSIAVPDPFKRDFNRLAAILEMADNQFDRLVIGIGNYKKGLVEKIKNQPAEIEINNLSLRISLETNAVLLESKKIIKNITKAKLHSNRKYDPLVERLHYFDIHNIGQLNDLLLNEKDHYLRFVKMFVEEHKAKFIGKNISESVCIIYLLHFLAGKTGNETTVADYITKFYGSLNFDPIRYIRIYQETLRA